MDSRQQMHPYNISKFTTHNTGEFYSPNKKHTFLSNDIDEISFIILLLWLYGCMCTLLGNIVKFSVQYSEEDVEILKKYIPTLQFTINIS